MSRHVAETVGSAFLDAIADAIQESDIVKNEVESAIENHDFQDAIHDELINFDFSDYVEKELDKQLLDAINEELSNTDVVLKDDLEVLRTDNNNLKACFLDLSSRLLDLQDALDNLNRPWYNKLYHWGSTWLESLWKLMPTNSSGS